VVHITERLGKLMQGVVEQTARAWHWYLVLLAEHGQAISSLSASSAQPLLFSSV